jgi:hypothetical protein
MTFAHYRIYIALILTTLSGVAVFAMERVSPIDIEESIRESIMANIVSSGVHMRPDEQ